MDGLAWKAAAVGLNGADQQRSNSLLEQRISRMASIPLNMSSAFHDQSHWR